MYPLYFEIYLIGRTNRLNPVHSLRSDFILRSLRIRFNKSYFFGGGGVVLERKMKMLPPQIELRSTTTIAVNGTGELKTDVIFVAWCKKSLKFGFFNLCTEKQFCCAVREVFKQTIYHKHELDIINVYPWVDLKRFFLHPNSYRNLLTYNYKYICAKVVEKQWNLIRNLKRNTGCFLNARL